MGVHPSPLAVHECGVPEVSSFSPLLFNIYLQPLIATLADMDCRVHNYMDDTQLLLRLENSTASYARVQTILRYIYSWMNSNFLKLNPEKTELLVVKASKNPWSDLYWPAEMGPSPSPVPAVKSLGLVIDTSLSMS